MAERSRRIHKFPRLRNKYSGPRFHPVDVVDPADPTKFKTRSMTPEVVLHFELLAPSAAVESGDTLIVPTLPLNFEVRNVFVTFTRYDGVEAAMDTIRETMKNALIGIGISPDNAELIAFDFSIYHLFGGGNPNVENAYSSYTKDPPTNGQSVTLIFTFVKKWLVDRSVSPLPSNSILNQLAIDIDAALNISSITMKFGEGPTFANIAVWNQIKVEPGELSIEATIGEGMISHSNPLGLKIESLSALLSGSLKGLTLWLVGSFDYPYNISRKAID